jgi:hypothetical protein
MKTMSWEQAQGLAWFLFVYALSRFLVELLVMSDQSMEIIVIFFGAMVIAWLVYTSQKSQGLFTLLVASLFVTSVFIHVAFESNIAEVKMALVLIGGFSFVSFLFFLATSIKRLLKKQENMLWAMVIQMAATIIFVTLLEAFLPNLTRAI